MSSDVAPDFRAPADPDEVRCVGDLLRDVFRFPDDRLVPYLDAVGHDNLRQVRVGGQIVGALALVPMGQWFGGRPVPTGGIAAVGVGSGRRGRGIGSRLMAGILRELHERRVPLSTLYPATLTFYRRFGYELAGGRYEVTVELARIDPSAFELDVTAITEDDEPTIETLYRRRAAETAGNLDRGSFIWWRVRRPPRGPSYGLRVGPTDRPEGYVYYAIIEGRGDQPHDLSAQDIVATTPAAARTLLAVLADERSMAQTLFYRSWPGDPLLATLAEAVYKIRLKDQWMVRVVRVPEALEARGYPSPLRARLPLRVADDRLEANNGCFELEVENGSGHVRPGGAGTISMTVRALAALYTGHRTPHELRTTGQLHADVDELATLATVFGGPVPWMVDVF